MAGNAQRRVLGLHARGIKTGPMRTEPEAAANGGVTRRTIALGMTRGAGFQTLAGRLSVSETETTIDVVITGAPDARIGCHQPR